MEVSLQESLEPDLYRLAKLGDLTEIQHRITRDRLTPTDLYPIVQVAAGYGHLALTKFLIQQGAPYYHLEDGEDPRCFAFGNACRYGRLEVVRYLLSLGVAPENGNYYGFCHACRANRLEIVQLLVEDYGVEVTIRDNLPLRVATEDRAHEVVEYLLAQGADLHTQEDFPLQITLMKNDLLQLRILLRHGLKITDPRYLMEAGKHQSWRCFRFLTDQHPEWDLSLRDSLMLYYMIRLGDVKWMQHIWEQHPELEAERLPWLREKYPDHPLWSWSRE